MYVSGGASLDPFSSSLGLFCLTPVHLSLHSHFNLLIHLMYNQAFSSQNCHLFRFTHSSLFDFTPFRLPLCTRPPLAFSPVQVPFPLFCCSLNFFSVSCPHPMVAFFFMHVISFCSPSNVFQVLHLYHLLQRVRPPFNSDNSSCGNHFHFWFRFHPLLPRLLLLRCFPTSWSNFCRDGQSVTYDALSFALNALFLPTVV